MAILIGSAGEHYVMAELLRRGVIAAKAPEGVPNMDILVTSLEGENLAAVQVKTRSGIGRDGGWHMRPKHESLTSHNLFYVYVDLGNGESHPSFHIVPSAVVADAISSAHRIWLNKPGRNGQRHNDTSMRRFMPDHSHLMWEGIDAESKDFILSHSSGWLKPYENNWIPLLGVGGNAASGEIGS
jgi:hypothetical protein